MPVDCKTVEPHAPLIIGQDPLIPLKLERKALNRANARTSRCVEHAESHFIVKPSEK